MTVSTTQNSPSSSYGLEYYRTELWNLSLLREYPLYPFCVEEAYRVRPVLFRDGASPYFMLVLLFSGTVEYTFGVEKLILKPGFLLMIPKGTEYQFHIGPGESYRKLLIEIRGDALLPVQSSFGLDEPFLARLPDDYDFASRILSIREGLTEQRLETIPELLTQTFEVMAHASSLREKCGTSSLGLPECVLKTCFRIESHPGSLPTLQELASLAGTDKRTLERRFLGAMGMTVWEYAIRKRMELAENLLCRTGESVKEIAERIGYCNAFYFSSEFKRLKGVSPTEFRRKMGFFQCRKSR